MLSNMVMKKKASQRVEERGPLKSVIKREESIEKLISVMRTLSLSKRTLERMLKSERGFRKCQNWKKFTQLLMKRESLRWKEKKIKKVSSRADLREKPISRKSRMMRNLRNRKWSIPPQRKDSFSQLTLVESTMKKPKKPAKSLKSLKPKEERRRLKNFMRKIWKVSMMLTSLMTNSLLSKIEKFSKKIFLKDFKSRLESKFLSWVYIIFSRLFTPSMKPEDFDLDIDQETEYIINRIANIKSDQQFFTN